ncbi:peptidase M24 [Thermodesulfatator indicus DSM 15286]|uniref:Peptidase M24 n=1 Tax=Thermodesulfatator indicus (strain DSM 15286 / JCM 11887 / CIR29812) TaxID=667014 RepID=F8AB71_THEID|nr:Xaa-Pro peptidase family protein [Thermodesulfatator indicus]AEH45527.1 peptidase M24 [Thermodesulfatator indicus DSM 15286]
MPADREEFTRRIALLAERLSQKGFDAALIRYPLNIFYFTGAFVDGHLVITKRAEVFLLVYRTLGRPDFNPVAEVIPFRSLKKLPVFLADLSIKTLGLEEDRLPINLYRRYQKLLAAFDLGDISEIVRNLRAIKSRYEIDCLKKAAEILSDAIYSFLPKLKPGFSELEAAGLLEAELRKRGHPAFTRTYGFGQELAYGHLLSGKSGVIPAFVTTGQGGQGIYGFPQGPSEKKIQPNELILIDYAGWHEGYMVDQSRLFYFGNIPQKTLAIYDKVLALLEDLEQLLRPGISVQKLYERAVLKAEELGISEYFMAHGPEKVPFVGHGVGLEIDEWPPIASLDITLEENMVIALEPKCHVPEIGVIGLEDTYHITANGPERLTLFPRKIISLLD